MLTETFWFLFLLQCCTSSNGFTAVVVVGRRLLVVVVVVVKMKPLSPGCSPKSLSWICCSRVGVGGGVDARFTFQSKQQ